MRHVTAAVLGLGIGLAVLAPARARACGNAFWATDFIIYHLGRAENLLAEGTTNDALRILRRVRGMLDGTEPSYARIRDEFPIRRSHVALIEARLSTLLAVAIVRRDGAVDRRSLRPLRRVRAPARESALRWALAQLAAATDTDPLARARYAEAQAGLPDLEGEALSTLSDLAARDLMPDAWGWRTLATIRERRGETELRDQALGRCRTAAGGAAVAICGASLVAAAHVPAPSAGTNAPIRGGATAGRARPRASGSP